jgi:hypothetical protein
MAWSPPDQQVDLTLQRIITRAREEALNSFQDQRKRIEREQSAKGVMGGPVFTRSRDAADEAIRRFGARIVPELLEILRDVYGGTPPLDAIQWIRETVNQDVDNLTDGLGGQIDSLKTVASIKGARERLQPSGFQVKRDMEIELAKVEIRARLVHPVPTPNPTDAAVEYDVFICHASEDKAAVAEPLAAALQQRKLRVWLDKYEIRIGDRILSRIDDGLSRSRFGVVIISPHFFDKQWSQMELNALAALEASAGATKILPIWHNMTLAQVQERSPLLAAVRAATTAQGIEAIADEIADVLNRAIA